jgi:acetyl-CoA carboxylase carboxyltransferase component
MPELTVGQGIVANQRKVVKTKMAKCNLWRNSDSADKATRFIANCNQKKIPVFARRYWFYGRFKIRTWRYH